MMRPWVLLPSVFASPWTNPAGEFEYYSLKVHATTVHEGIRRRVNKLEEAHAFFAVVLFDFHTPTTPPPCLRTDDIEGVCRMYIFYTKWVLL
jgi:hypothetical protein